MKRRDFIKGLALLPIAAYIAPKLREDVLGLKETGTTYFVDPEKGKDWYHGRSPDRPLATLDEAMRRTTPLHGDMIYLNSDNPVLL